MKFSHLLKLGDTIESLAGTSYQVIDINPVIIAITEDNTHWPWQESWEQEDSWIKTINNMSEEDFILSKTPEQHLEKEREEVKDRLTYL